MTQTTTTHGKILLGDAGLGTLTEEMVENRARQLAQIDGREAFNQGDLDHARRELQGQLEPDEAPEVEQRTDELQEWDEPEGAAGHQTPNVGLDDEGAALRRLVAEGLDEAEHDQRVAAAETARDEDAS